MGVNNTLTGSQGKESENTMLTGFHNTADKVSNTTVIGSENTVTNSKNSLVMGDNREVKDVNHAVLIGSTDSKTTTSVNNAVAVGHNTNVTVEGGVALGSESRLLWQLDPLGMIRVQRHSPRIRILRGRRLNRPYLSVMQITILRVRLHP